MNKNYIFYEHREQILYAVEKSQDFALFLKEFYEWASYGGRSHNRHFHAWELNYGNDWSLD